MSVVTNLGAAIGLVAACAVLAVARATYYRRQKPKPSAERRRS